MMKIWEKKPQDRTLSKNDNQGLVFFIKKNPGRLCPWFFF
jgi:hypothetical protein